MGRVRTFDEGAVLDKAMLLFWRRGYEATSINDLVEELGLGRGSIYAAFGDKHTLFLRALDRYLGRQAELLSSTLDNSQPAMVQVRRLFVRLLQADGRSNAGCLSVNSVAELLPDDRAVAELVRTSLRTAEDAITAQFVRAQEVGELSTAIGPREAARHLVALLQGLQILGKIDPDPARLVAVLDSALVLIKSPVSEAAY